MFFDIFYLLFLGTDLVVLILSVLQTEDLSDYTSLQSSQSVWVQALPTRASRAPAMAWSATDLLRLSQANHSLYFDVFHKFHLQLIVLKCTVQ